MTKMTKLEKKIATIILTIVLVGILGVALHFFIYQPNKDQIETLSNEIESLADKVEEAKKAPALIVSYTVFIRLITMILRMRPSS